MNNIEVKVVFIVERQSLLYLRTLLFLSTHLKFQVGRMKDCKLHVCWCALN